MKFRHMHIAELLTTIHAEYKEFLEKHKESAALGKAGSNAGAKPGALDARISRATASIKRCSTLPLARSSMIASTAESRSPDPSHWEEGGKTM